MSSHGSYADFNEAPPPPPPVQSFVSGYASMNNYYSQSQYSYSTQAYATIAPGTVQNPPIPGQDDFIDHSYPPPPPPDYSSDMYDAPPPPPPPPPNYTSHLAPPPPPPPETHPSSYQHQNEVRSHFDEGLRHPVDQRLRTIQPLSLFDQGPRQQFDQRPAPQFGQRPRPLFDQRPRPLFDQRSRPESRPRPPQSFAERGSLRPRSHFQGPNSRPRFPEPNSPNPRFRPSGGLRFQSPQPRSNGPPGFSQRNQTPVHRQPGNSYRSNGPPRFGAKFQNENTARVARNPPTSRFSVPIFNNRFERPVRPNGKSEAHNSGGSLLKPAYMPSTVVESQPDKNSQPLQPPPMPPVFSFGESELKLPDCITELKVSDTGLPFVPVPLEKIDLDKMAEKLEKQEQEINGATINNLVKEGSILATWPMELKELFQPLFCKLCVITLSSAVVAMAHYKGKKHKKKVEIWLADDRRKRFGGRVPGAPPGFQPTRSVSEPAGSLPLPISGSNATPLGCGFAPGKKRTAPDGVGNPSGSSKYFPLGRPPKKPKTDPNSGIGFGLCELCNVSLTSQAHANDHYSGKPHAKKLQSVRKDGSFGEDPRFGIGKSFLRRNELDNSVPPVPVQPTTAPQPPQDDFIHQLPILENDGLF